MSQPRAAQHAWLLVMRASKAHPRHLRQPAQQERGAPHRAPASPYVSALGDVAWACLHVSRALLCVAACTITDCIKGVDVASIQGAVTHAHALDVCAALAIGRSWWRLVSLTLAAAAARCAACLSSPPLLESPGLAGGWSCNSSLTPSGTVCTATCAPGLSGSFITTCVRGAFSAVAGSCGEHMQQEGALAACMHIRGCCWMQRCSSLPDAWLLLRAAAAAVNCSLNLTAPTAPIVSICHNNNTITASFRAAAGDGTHTTTFTASAAPLAAVCTVTPSEFAGMLAQCGSLWRHAHTCSTALHLLPHRYAARPRHRAAGRDMHRHRRHAAARGAAQHQRSSSVNCCCWHGLQ